jgi:hypothetical protein
MGYMALTCWNNSRLQHTDTLINYRDLRDKSENREQTTILKRNGKIAEQGQETGVRLKAPVKAGKE